MSGNPFLKRYLSGECEKAWAEIMRLPESPENEAMAWEVAEVFVDRADETFAEIREGFEELGYAFKNPEAVVTSPDNDIEELFEDCESTYGRLPIILKAWYRRFGSIDFRQDPIQEEEDATLAHLGHRIPLIFMTFSECLEGIDDWNCADGTIVKHLPTGHYCTSNNPVGFCFPSHFFDDEFDSDLEDPFSPESFGSFGLSLRTIFKRGGLHGFWEGVYEGRFEPFNFWERWCDIQKILPSLRKHTRLL